MTEADAPAAAGACASPPDSRWKKGQSGNPRGGPKRPAPATAEVERLMRRSFEVVSDGVRERLPFAEALLLAMAHRALNGCVRTTDRLLALMEKAEAKREAERRARAEKARRRAAEARLRREAGEEEAALAGTAALLQEDGYAMFDAEHALMRLGLMVWSDGAPALPSWVVDCARARNPGLKLSEADQRLIDSVVKLEVTEAELSGGEPDGAAGGGCCGGGGADSGPPPAAPAVLSDAWLEKLARRGGMPTRWT